MTSIAWPTEFEYYMWFEGNTLDAVDWYMADSLRKCSEWPNPPTKEEVRQIFVDCLNIPARTVIDGRFVDRFKPYERFRIQKCLSLLASLERKFSFKLDR